MTLLSMTLQEDFFHEGYTACPWCGVDLKTKHFVKLEKQTYGEPQQWLRKDHPYKFVTPLSPWGVQSALVSKRDLGSNSLSLARVYEGRNEDSRENRAH